MKRSEAVRFLEEELEGLRLGLRLEEARQALDEDNARRVGGEALRRWYDGETIRQECHNANTARVHALEAITWRILAGKWDDE